MVNASNVMFQIVKLVALIIFAAFVILVTPTLLAIVIPTALEIATLAIPTLPIVGRVSLDIH
jgi:hypothetical protein